MARQKRSEAVGAALADRLIAGSPPPGPSAALPAPGAPVTLVIPPPGSPRVAPPREPVSGDEVQRVINPTNPQPARPSHLDAGRELAESLASEAPADRNPVPACSPTDKAPPPLFVSANLGVGVTPDLERIISVVFAADAMRDYADLEENLAVGEERGDYKTLTKHLDKAEDRARRAHRLYLGAKLELEKWERDQEKVTADMRTQANDELQKEKDDGKRSKAITDADTVARIAEMFPDEYTAQRVNRAKLRGVVEHLEFLSGLWKQRCHSLGTMLSNLRK